MGGRISSGGDIGYLNISRRKKVSEVKNNSLLIEANYIDGVGHAIFTRRAGTSFANRNCQVVIFGQLFEGIFEARQRMPVARYEHQDSEFRTKRRHAAFLDVSAAGKNHLGDILNHASAIRTNRR